MQEIRFHGRGGQGAVTAAELVSVAAFYDGKNAQAFGAFGPERRGAPVMSFTRIDDKPIKERQQIYNPTIIVVLDPTLMKTVDVLDGANQETTLVLNTRFNKKCAGVKCFILNATKIANEELGRPIVNTAMLGGLIKATEIVSMESMKKAIRERFPEKLAEKNIKAIEKAYKECV